MLHSYFRSMEGRLWIITSYALYRLRPLGLSVNAGPQRWAVMWKGVTNAAINAWPTIHVETETAINVSTPNNSSGLIS